jgi:hypothetical protein
MLAGLFFKPFFLLLFTESRGFFLRYQAVAQDV